MLVAPHMTPIERKLYEDLHEEDYRGFRIVPKRDFGRYGFWSAEHLCNLNAGWVICYGESHRFRGCNAMPGATFAWTLAQAKEMIDDLIRAEENAARFWELRNTRRVEVA